MLGPLANGRALGEGGIARPSLGTRGPGLLRVPGTSGRSNAGVGEPAEFTGFVAILSGWLFDEGSVIFGDGLERGIREVYLEYAVAAKQHE